jgi:hypothetical protein
MSFHKLLRSILTQLGSRSISILDLLGCHHGNSGPSNNQIVLGMM